MRKGAKQCDLDDGGERGKVSVVPFVNAVTAAFMGPQPALAMVRPPGLEPGTAGLEIRDPTPVAASEPSKSGLLETPPADTPAVECGTGVDSCSDSEPNAVRNTGEERELSELSAAWPKLSPSIKAAILALVKVGGESE